MKKGCGLTLVLWLALVGVYGYVAFQRIHVAFPAAMIGVLGGTFAAALVSSFIGLFTGAHDRAALRRAINADAVRDGRLEAASGQIRPIGAPLDAPFTGRPCVAYEYDVKQPDAGASEFAGFALAPCAIQTTRGPVRVLGWAMLDQFRGADPSAIDRARGAAYLQNATFEHLGVTSILSVMSELIADDDGSIRKDLRIDGDPNALQGALAGREIQERSVPVDAVVTMLGKWSEAKQGFAAGGTTINRLFPADLETTRRSVSGNAVKTFGIGLFFFLGLHAMLLPMLLLAPGGKSSSPAAAQSVWDERDCDRQKASLAAGADANEIGSDGLTPLMNAARMDESACVANLIAAGAKLEAADKNGDTAMAQAITAGRDDNVAILRKAGARDFRVTAATGQPVTQDSPPLVVVKDYIAAIHRGDFRAMAELMLGSSVQAMEEHRDVLQLWQSMRPKDSDLVDGWMTEEAATLTVRGTTPEGARRVAYHVLRRVEGWRIKREWFPDPR